MRYGIRGTGYAVCCTQCEAWVMCLEILIMGIAVSNLASEYRVGGVNFTQRVRDMMYDRVRDMMFECGTGYEVRDMRYVVHSVRYG